MKRLPLVVLSIAALFIVDRFSKWCAMHLLPPEGVFLISHTTGFVLERNQGIAYSIPLPQAILILSTSLIIIILVAFLVNAYQRRELDVVFSYGLIIVGAFSNLLDRLRYGYVIDLVVLTSWPVFNLADIMILAGVIWLIIHLMKKSVKG